MIVMNKENFENILESNYDRYGKLYVICEDGIDKVLKKLNDEIDKILKIKMEKLEKANEILKTKINIYSSLISNSNFKIVDEILEKSDNH